MPIDASIPLGVKTPEIMNPGQMMSLQNVARQGQLQQVQLESAQQDLQKKNALRQVMQGATDPTTGRLTPQGISQITQIDPAMGMQLGHQQEQLRLQDLAINQKKDDIRKRVGTAYVTSYDRYLQQTGGNTQEATRLAQQDTQAAIGEMEKNGTLAQSGLDPQSIQGLKTLPPPEQMRSMVTSLGGTPITTQEPEIIKEMRSLGVKPGSDEWNSTLKKSLAKKTAPTQSMISLYPDSQMSDDALKFTAQQYLAGDRSVISGFARNPQMRARLQQAIVQEARASGATPKDVAAAIGEFEGFKSGQRTLGTREAQIQLAGNVTAQFAPLAVDASEHFDRTNIKTINDVEKAALSRTSSPELRRFNFANLSLINAYARAINPQGVGNESDKAHAREVLDTGFSKGDYRAAVDQLMKEINAELKAPGSVKAGMRSLLTGKGEEPAAPAPSKPAAAAAPASKGVWKMEKIQ